MSNELDLLYLASCAVNGRKPEAERVRDMDLKALYRMGKEQLLTVLLFKALEPLAFDAELKKQWVIDRDMAVRKELLFDIEADALYEDLEDMGCAYLPLKGSVLKELYPYSAMRQRTDVDVLYDPAFMRQVYDRFLECGYRNELFGVGHDDTYQKPPVYNFEMHRSLFGEDNDALFENYFSDIRSRLIPTSPNGMRLQMTTEDLYIYMQAHTRKHFDAGGTGLRFLLDTDVFLKAYRETADWNRIEAELSKLGILEFDQCLRALCDKVISRPESFRIAELNEEEAKMLDAVLGSKLFGDRKGRAERMLEQERGAHGRLTLAGKARYCLNRLFPPPSKLMRTYPFFLRHKWLVPAGYLYRIVVMPLRYKEDMRKELRVLKERQ